jgi:hypothetical protein
MSDLSDRVSTAKRLGMHPHLSGDIEFTALTEGEHYDVVAYTDWADYFVPTVVRWDGADEVDQLTDPEASVAAAREALGRTEVADV